MKTSKISSTAVVLAALAALFSMLSLHQTTGAQTPKGAGQPFANAVEQRMEMIAELKAIQDLLREQNDLLRSGKLTVIVDHPPAK